MAKLPILLIPASLTIWPVLWLAGTGSYRFAGPRPEAQVHF